MYHARRPERGDGGQRAAVLQHGCRFSEMVYQTSGLGATASEGGGLFINMIPKEGGNHVPGRRVRGRTWCTRATTSATHLKSLGAGRRRRSMQRIWDVNPSLGGPIVQNKLWFFTSYRWWGMNQPIAGSFYQNTTSCPGLSVGGKCQNIDDNHIQDLNVRFTWQISPRNKLSRHVQSPAEVPRPRFDRGRRPGDRRHGVDLAVLRHRDREVDLARQQPTADRRRVQRDLPGLLADDGAGRAAGSRHGCVARRRGEARPEHGRPVRRGDGISLTFNHRYGFQTSASYVTGTNSIRVGGSWQWAQGGGINDGNADLTQHVHQWRRDQRRDPQHARLPRRHRAGQS